MCAIYYGTFSIMIVGTHKEFIPDNPFQGLINIMTHASFAYPAFLLSFSVVCCIGKGQSPKQWECMNKDFEDRH